MIKIISLFALFFIISCSNIDFIYTENNKLTNPLYDKTGIDITGSDLVFINSYIPFLFGNNKNNEFNLLINIEEIKTKRAVKTNQVTSNLRYELRFTYILKSNKKDCLIYNKKIISNFTIIPKSAGYNYGTDASLEKKYELAITENLEQFVSLLSRISINDCK
tara:strand:- start:3953 stop:4441 length:489 start_codon:yes stop_codon:yes gene_type:complete